jgi:tetratricopeptide (TPR) repeat protein
VLLKHAIELDPNYAAAYAALAETDVIDVTMGWAEFPTKLLDRAEGLANKALSLNDSEVRAHVVLGRIAILYHRYHEAKRQIDRAIAINPNDAFGLAGRGNILMWLGQTDAAIEDLELAQRIDPEPTSLAAEVSGKAWLFTLGQKGGATPGGSKVAEIGPIPPITSPEYLLRINHASGPPGAKTPVHSHPGSEAFYVLAGRLGQKTPEGVHYAKAGEAMNGHGPGMAMEVFSAGTSELDQFVMFLVDDTKLFSEPAKFE